MSQPKHKKFKPLVSAATRTGFTLLVNIARNFLPYSNSKKSRHVRILKELTRFLGKHIESEVIGVFKNAGVEDKLLYNGLFRELEGGTKWLHETENDKACVRKYLGVKGMGDFTIITSHPREIFDVEDVVHSHVDPRRWFRDDYYEKYTRFASVRNPAGTINSALFSINALTSEYIQRYLSEDEDNDEIRQNIAKVKLTDIDFFKSVQKYYTSYLHQLIEVKDKFIIMRWEDLIQTPIPTILKLAYLSGIELSSSDAEKIWDDMDHKNLTGPHKHNLRRGKGKVNDWKNWLVNEHIEILKGENVEVLMAEFGYEKLEYFDERFYTPFQEEVARLIKKGSIFDQINDTELLGFSIQKSNVDWRDLKGFRGYEWRDHTLLERSCFSDKKIERDVWDKYEESIGFANRIITQYIKLQNEEKEVLKLIDKLIYEFSQRCNWFDSILYKRNLLKLKNRIADGQYD